MKGKSKIWEHRLEAVGRHYERLRSEISPDEVHDFRVAVKKLKALTRLWNSGQDREDRISLGGRMKRIYQLTGDIRNLQLHAQRITDLATQHNWQRPATYLLALDMQITLSTEALPAAFRKFSFHHFRDAILQRARAVSFEHTRRYLLQQRDILLALLLPGSDEALHELRKVLKDLGYNHDLIGPELLALLPAGLRDLDGITSMSDRLGTFHDLCVSIGLLRPAFLEQLDEAEKNTLLVMKEQLVHERDHMRRELQSLLAQFARGFAIQAQ